MKRVLIFCLTLTLLQQAKTQDSQEVVYDKKANEASSKIKNVKLNMAVPDAPAFKALGSDPSEILRPSDPKQFALMLPQFLSGNNLVVPSSFAAEVSPGLLLANYSLNDYYKNPVLRALVKTRLSIGSGSSDSLGRKLAFGIRTTLYESRDFKADRDFINANIRKKYLRPIHIAVEDSITRYQYTHPEFFTLDQDAQKQIRKAIKKALVDQMGDAFAHLPETIDSLKEIYKKKFWNASRLDFAYSFLAQSSDSTLKNVAGDKHIFWLSGAIRPGNNWMQLLFSVNTKLFRLVGTSKSEWIVNHRTYIGVNRIKGFAEAQYKKAYLDVNTSQKSLFWNVGLEVSVWDGVWVHIGTGVINYLDIPTRKNELMGNFNLYLTFPEKFSF